MLAKRCKKIDVLDLVSRAAMSWSVRVIYAEASQVFVTT